MKIRDTKIAEKLPDVDVCSCVIGEECSCGWDSRNKHDKKVLSTDLDLEDIVELDVEKVDEAIKRGVEEVCEDCINDCDVLNCNIVHMQILKAIAKAKPFKLKE